MTANETSTQRHLGAARLHLLGRAELVHGHSGDDVWLRFLPERRFRLLTYLALRGEWVSRDELATLFWPDRAQEAARSNLRKLLQEARALDLPGLESDRNSVRWSVSTDVAEFKAAIERGDKDAAVTLYRGAALRGLDGGESDAFSAWLAGERRRLHSAWREAVVALLPGRDPAGALTLAQRLLDDDPFDEDGMVAALGAHRALGNSGGAREAFRTYAERLIEELGVEPSARVRLAAGPISSPPGQEAAPAPPHATAPALTAFSFIGRSRELQELSALLTNPGCRLLTVTGPGGMGKSRIVKHAARNLAARYADGVIWIPLGDLSDIAHVAPRIVAELALVLAPGQDPIACIAERIVSRQLLLVLDNCEHLPRLSALLDQLIGAAPRLQVLATSRSPIGIRVEWLLPLSGLTLPSPHGSPHEVVAADAVQMFTAHARAADPRFDAGTNLPQIARLVRAVGGLPLAIQLAASWVRLLPMTELAKDITQSLELLECADEGEERAEHRSMRATFEQSWRLLAPAEQQTLAALAVFAGGFSRAAAFAVADASVVLLSSLVDKSLLQVDDDDVASRFRLHPLLRHFARGKLGTDDERRHRLSRHASHFGQWLADTEQALRGAEQPTALAALEQQLPDCHAAWAYAIEQRDAPFIERATLSLMYYYEARGRRADGIALFSTAERALDVTPGATASLAMLARALSTLRYRSGEMALTIDTATRGIALARRAGARPALKGCLLNLGLAHYQRRQLDAARRCIEEALALARADHDLAGIAAFVNSLAMVEQDTGDNVAAEAHYREALGLNRELHNSRGTLSALNNLALLLLESKRAAAALPLYEEGLRLCAQQGIAVMRANFLLGLGGTRLALGQLPVARDLTQQALEAAHANGEPYVAVEAQMQLARIALAAGDAVPALRLALQALRESVKLENLPVSLDAVHCLAECSAQAGDVRGAVALWLFIIAHPQTSDAERQRMQQIVDDATLPSADRAWAEDRAQRYELSSLADALAGSLDEGAASASAPRT